MAKKYIWLKLQKDFFKRKEMKKLRKMAGGAVYTVIYLKMQLLSLDDGGKLYFEGLEDNFIDELALELDENIEDVKMTVLFLQKYGFLTTGDVEDEYVLPDVVANIGSETASASRMRKLRAKQELEKLELKTKDNIAVTYCHNVTEELHNSSFMLLENETDENLEKSRVKSDKCHNVTSMLCDVSNSDIEKEREKDIDIERDEKISFLSRLSKMEFKEKLNLLKKVIIKVTGKDENAVNLVFRPSYYTDIIDDLLIAIKKSKYLRGELTDRRPNLNTYTVKAQIDRILAGVYEDYQQPKLQNEKATISSLKHQGVTADDLLKEINM